MDAANTREFEGLRGEMRRALCGGDGGNDGGEGEGGRGEGGPGGVGGTCQLAPVMIIKKAVPYSLLPALYRAVHAVALPSRGEGWGIPKVSKVSVCGTRSLLYVLLGRFCDPEGRVGVYPKSQKPVPRYNLLYEVTM